MSLFSESEVKELESCFSLFERSARVWNPLTREEMEEFRDNDSDLLEKWNVEAKDIVKSKLRIIYEHEEGLKRWNEITLEIFNNFDIWIKDKYDGNVVVFIDYDMGEVFLIRPISYTM